MTKKTIQLVCGLKTYPTNMLKETHYHKGLLSKFFQGVKEIILMNENYSDTKKQNLITKWENIRFEKTGFLAGNFCHKKLHMEIK